MYLQYQIALLLLILLFADAPCLIQWRSRIFFQGGDIEREVTVERVVEVCPILSTIPHPTLGDLGERRKLPQRGLGANDLPLNLFSPTFMKILGRRLRPCFYGVDAHGSHHARSNTFTTLPPSSKKQRHKETNMLHV